MEQLEQGHLLFPYREAVFTEDREIPISAKELCPIKSVKCWKARDCRCQCCCSQQESHGTHGFLDFAAGAGKCALREAAAGVGALQP